MQPRLGRQPLPGLPCEHVLWAISRCYVGASQRTALNPHIRGASVTWRHLGLSRKPVLVNLFGKAALVRPPLFPTNCVNACTQTTTQPEVPSLSNRGGCVGPCPPPTSLSQDSFPFVSSMTIAPLWFQTLFISCQDQSKSLVTNSCPCPQACFLPILPQCSQSDSAKTLI